MVVFKVIHEQLNKNPEKGKLAIKFLNIETCGGFWEKLIELSVNFN